MRSAVPLSLQEDLLHRANELLRSITKIGEIPVFDLRRLLADLDRLAAEDRVAADDIRSTLFLLNGQVEDAEACIRNIEKLGRPEVAAFRSLIHASNFLQSARARDLILACQKLGYPSMVNLFEAGLSVGAFFLTNSLIEDAQKGQRVIVDAQSQIAKIRSGTAVLTKLNISDEQIGKVIDVAGDLLRAKKLIWLNEMPDIRITGESAGSPGLLIAYRVHVSPSEAADMTCELVERQLDQDIGLPGFSVCFVGAAV